MQPVERPLCSGEHLIVVNALWLMCRQKKQKTLIRDAQIKCHIRQLSLQSLQEDLSESHSRRLYSPTKVFTHKTITFIYLLQA